MEHFVYLMPDLFYEGYHSQGFLWIIQWSFGIQSQGSLPLIRTKSFSLIRMGKRADLKISALTTIIILCLHSPKSPLKTGSRTKFGHIFIQDIVLTNKIMGRNEYRAKAGEIPGGSRRVVMSGNWGLVCNILFQIQKGFISDYNMHSQFSCTSSPSRDVMCLKKLTKRQALHGDPIWFPYFICQLAESVWVCRHSHRVSSLVIEDFAQILPKGVRKA